LVDEFTEVESGKRADRPELEKALAACKKQKAKLVIAKLDRLSRNLAFIATLMESGVEFVAVDNPHANKLTIHILAAVAQHEREMISERTKAALQAAKKRGQRLGNPGIAEAAKLGRAALKANARRFAANVRPIINEIVRAGATSHNAIAAKLNERNVRTARAGARLSRIPETTLRGCFYGPRGSRRSNPRSNSPVRRPSPPRTRSPRSAEA
jgi:DNA invertase Pin-like site-specific DNA recombinase